jgi:hypothetical protein
MTEYKTNFKICLNKHPYTHDYIQVFFFKPTFIHETVQWYCTKQNDKRTHPQTITL